MNFPQLPESYWRKTELPQFKELNSNLEVDVAIVGAGITGITTGLLLKKAGYNVTIIDADSILNGTTGHTTAKVTVQHNLIYNELLNNLGEEKAKLYFDANNMGLKWIKDYITKNKVECDFTEEDAYIYTNSTNYLTQIENESSAYNQLGIPGEMISKLPLNIPVKTGLVLRKQAQFHPIKYLKHLIKEFVNLGGLVFENTPAVDIEKGERPIVKTKKGFNISSKHIVITSHFPFLDMFGFYFTRMYAERSYILAAKIQEEFPGGMYISAESPTRSLRYTTLENGQKFVLIGGESHKVGQGVNTIRHYEALKSFGEQTFRVEEFLYRWSAQDLFTLDKVPYVGQITSNTNNIFVATGYGKWGMTNGTAAALLIKELITTGNSIYKDLFTPSRFNTDPSVKQFFINNADVAKHFIDGKLEFAIKKPDDLDINEGSVVSVNGKRAGAYKDEEGRLHIVDTTCTHMGCELEWNNGEKSWDCPCHGSRFSFKGDVLEGPAKKTLRRIE
ncbi:FAD-dependent oxidoreductase [Bacillus timonensis]|nr:FAD-dependent oxidoreductase [Bacillus timonensis]